MEISDGIPYILNQFGLHVADFRVERIGSGHINHTFLLSGKSSFILQRINTAVFRKPERVAKNIRLAADYLKYHFNDYLFLSPIKNSQQEEESRIVPSTKLSRSSDVDGEEDLNITIRKAVGGRIVSFRNYDRKSDRHSWKTYVIHDELDFERELGKIITLESLR